MKKPNTRAQQKKGSVPMKANEEAAQKAMKAFWTVRPPEDVRKLLAEYIRRSGATDRSKALYDVLRLKLADVLNELGRGGKGPGQQ